MNIILPSLGLLLACVLVWIFKRWTEPVLGIVLGAGVCLTLMALLFLRKGEAISQRGNFGDTVRYGGVPRTVSEEDQKFLNDLFEQEKRDQEGTDVAGAKSAAKTVPRGELNINNSEIRRAQLVVNSRVVKRAELVRPKYR
jgi:hypothetical protein